MLWIDTDGSKKSWKMYELRKLFNFMHKTKFNAELQESNSMNWIIWLFVSTFIQYKSQFSLDLKIKLP